MACTKSVKAATKEIIEIRVDYRSYESWLLLNRQTAETA